MSSWIAVTNSRVPATLKSMSPSASSAPRMSVRVTNLPSSAIMPIAMPATGDLIGTPASISDSVDPQTEAIEVEPLDDEHVAHQPQRVGELFLRRDHRDERALGERPVADLATARRADAARLARRERREVVVVHVPLGVLEVERVDHLRHPQHAERRDVQHLGVAPAEQRRAVRPLAGRRPRPRAAGCRWRRGRPGGCPRRSRACA